MNLWSAYVARLLSDSGASSEAEFLATRTVQQGTFNRWRRGKSVPTSAAAVAEFARECDRNPLEAFVAAGMLDVEEAGRGLGEVERALLADLMRPARGRTIVYADTSTIAAYMQDLDGKIWVHRPPGSGRGAAAQADLWVKHTDGSETPLEIKWSGSEEQRDGRREFFEAAIAAVVAKINDAWDEHASAGREDELSGSDRKLLDYEQAILDLERAAGAAGKSLADLAPDAAAWFARRSTMTRPAYWDMSEADLAARNEDREKRRLD